MLNKKIGVLGGGQLGKMLIQKGLSWGLNFSVLDPDISAPCSAFSGFVNGSITDFNSVMHFGATCDIITIEIENVNTQALELLEKQGKEVFPQSSVIRCLQDKAVQKKFYFDNHIPTAEYILTDSLEAVKRNVDFLPAVHKLSKAGYDGRGVQVLRSSSDLKNAFDKPGYLEKFVDFEKEISVIVARNKSGEVATFKPVELVSHPTANMLEHLYSPARIEESLSKQSMEIANTIINKLEMVGVLAVEMFVSKSGQLLVNESAPRPHNSGHQTIEASMTSQYEQLLRAILNLPLGDTSEICSSAMINLFGKEGYNGIAKFVGIKEVMSIPGSFLHLYGKKQTKPFRKMGHITILENDLERLKDKLDIVKQNFKIIS